MADRCPAKTSDGTVRTRSGDSTALEDNLKDLRGERRPFRGCLSHISGKG